MTESDWMTSTDPVPMLGVLSRCGQQEALWRFTVDCCNHVRDQLPGRAFQQVLKVGESLSRGEATWEMVADAMAEANRRLDKLHKRFDGSDDEEEQERLNRKIGVAGVVFAFDFQEGYEASRYASEHLIEWADDPEAEKSRQAGVLRRIVTNPFDLPASVEGGARPNGASGNSQG